MTGIRNNILGFILLSVGALLAAYWLIQMLMLWSQVGSNAGYWAARRDEAKSSRAIVFMAIGDSTAQGIGASKPDKGYVGILAEKIELETGRPVKVVNVSLTGAQMQDAANRQAQLIEKYKPDVLTVVVGMHDVKDFQPAAFAASLDDLLINLPKGSIISDVPTLGGGPAEDRVEQMNKIIVDRIRKEPVIYVPLYDYTRSKDSVFQNYAYDWYHPNDRGYEIWAEAIWPSVQQRLRQLKVDDGAAAPV